MSGLPWESSEYRLNGSGSEASLFFLKEGNTYEFRQLDGTWLLHGEVLDHEVFGEDLLSRLKTDPDKTFLEMTRQI